MSQKLDLKIQSSDISDLDYFNIEQKCYLIMKGLNAKNFNSFYRSLSVEKKQYFQDKEISSENLRAILDTFQEKNSKLTINFFKQKDLRWSGFVSTIFFDLLKGIGDINVSLFLVKDKIYFPVDFGDIILNVFKPETRKHYSIEKIWKDNDLEDGKVGFG